LDSDSRGSQVEHQLVNLGPRLCWQPRGIEALPGIVEDTRRHPTRH